MAQDPAPPRKRGRPRKTASEQEAGRERLLRSGVAVLTEKGFSAVGIEEILSAASVPKGSFYGHFASKEAFGHALIDAYDAYFARKLDRWFLDHSRPPLARLLAFVEDAKAGMARHGFRRGCLIGNLGQEMGTLPELVPRPSARGLRQLAGPDRALPARRASRRTDWCAGRLRRTGGDVLDRLGGRGAARQAGAQPGPARCFRRRVLPADFF